MIDVVNLQRKVKLESRIYKEYVAELSGVVEEANGKTFSVAFISDRRMTELNKLFREKDSTTDVLSFPNEPDEFGNELVTHHSSLATAFIGDIVISADQAAKQAAENKLTLELEIKQLILHGLLHLCGYDHETDKGEMNKRELTLRKMLDI
jgi:probable rRNA maturation factor